MSCVKRFASTFASAVALSGMADELLVGRDATRQEPQLLASGVISTGNEYGITFTTDMRTAYFARSTPGQTTRIVQSEFRDGGWQPALPLPFSDDRADDGDPALSADGTRLWFSSNRPAPATAEPGKRNWDIWFVDRARNGWSAPQRVAELSSPSTEGSPVPAGADTLCFFSDRGRNPNSQSIYCARRRGQSYEAPVKLPPEVNSDASDANAFLSSDGNAMVFFSNRPGGHGKGDLYVSMKRNGRWTPAANLGPEVNSAESEYNPSVSPDGRTLYFGRGGHIYGIPVAAIKSADLNPPLFRRN